MRVRGVTQEQGENELSGYERQGLRGEVAGYVQTYRNSFNHHFSNILSF